jgi:hypothetical protein
MKIDTTIIIPSLFDDNGIFTAETVLLQRKNKYLPYYYTSLDNSNHNFNSFRYPIQNT